MAAIRARLSTREVLIGVLAVVLVGMLISDGGTRVGAQEPANKVSASGSTMEVFDPGTVTLLTEKVKTSNPTDLILGATLECSITTDVTTVGSDDQKAVGLIRVWVEIDNVPVPVSADDKGAGKVVFCNRTYQRVTQLGSDDNSDSIRTFIETRDANGFNWMALNVGSATHTITLKAELTTTATANASAKAVVGNRTLIIEPVKSANNEAVTAL